MHWKYGEACDHCFPKTEGDVVAKTRLAAEELYRMEKHKKEIRKRE